MRLCLHIKHITDKQSTMRQGKNNALSKNKISHYYADHDIHSYYGYHIVQYSVNHITSFVEDDLKGLDDAQLHKHMENAREYFDFIIPKTDGVLTYYYHIDPSISSTVKGFWYTNIDGKGFVEHEVTDITLYDVNDTSNLVWFTVPCLLNL